MKQHPEGKEVWSETGWGKNSSGGERYRDTEPCEVCGTPYPYRFRTTNDCTMCAAQDVVTFQEWLKRGMEDVIVPRVMVIHDNQAHIPPERLLRTRPCTKGPHFLTLDTQGDCLGCKAIGAVKTGAPKSTTRLFVEANTDCDMSKEDAINYGLNAFRGTSTCRHGHERAWRRVKGLRACLNCEWSLG